MRKVLIIGIGPGHPDYLTVQAIDALNRVDVFVIPDKGEEKAELQRLRLEICERYIKDKTYRLLDFKTPPRARESADYKGAVEDWHARIERDYEQLLGREVGEEECAGFLVWGDPALYDSTLRIVERIKARGVVAFDYEVIPGISSVQALAARHRIALNRVGESVRITTGRKLADEFTAGAGADTVVVMLDGEQSFKKLGTPDVDIYWGAYIGTADEILVAGRLADVAGEIEAARGRARKEKGWIMDTYLLRTPGGK